MIRYSLQRIAYSLVVMLVASIVIFYALRISPGTPVVSGPLATKQQIQILHHQLGLDQPILLQYVEYMGKAVRGDFGHSLFTGEPIGTIIQKNGQNSMALISGALALTLLLAIPLGALAGVRAGKTSDHVTLLFASLAIGIPNFVLALILISYFSVNLGWFPVGGQSGFKSLILPVIVLAAEGVGVTLRMMRSSMAEQLNQDYVRALRAKGLGQRAVVWTHAMRNAMLPVISLSALRIGTIIGYTVIVEMIFRWPGIGFQLVNGVLNHDYPVAQALSLLLVASVIVINLIADLVYAAVDPRIRLTGQAKA